MKKKRGMGHIEAILSIVLFVGFLAFALYFFNPLDTDRVVRSSLIYTLDEVSKNITVEVISYSIVLDDEVSGDIAMEIDNPEGYNVRVEDKDGMELDSGYESGKVHVKAGANKFLTVMFSKDFGESAFNQGTDEERFTISSSDKKEIWSYKRADGLKNAYVKDYFKVKKDFNLPENFGFNIVYNEDKIVAENEIPEGIQVYGDTEKNEFIDDTGKIIFAELNVKVW